MWKPWAVLNKPMKMNWFNNRCLEVNFNHIEFKVATEEIRYMYIFWRKRIAIIDFWWPKSLLKTFLCLKPTNLLVFPIFLLSNDFCVLLVLHCISVRTIFTCRFHKQTFSCWSIDCTVCSLSMCSFIPMC